MPQTRISAAGISGSGSAGAGWGTLLNIDFSAQSNQTFASDNTYTIGGIAGWKKENTAGEYTPTGNPNDRVHVQIVNGQGLIFQPATGTNYTGATRTTPLLWLPFSAIATNLTFDWDVGVRIWWEMFADAAITNGDSTIVGIDTDSMIYSLVSARNYNGANERGLATITINNASTQAVSTHLMANTTAACGVFAAHCPFLLQNSPSLETFSAPSPMPANFNNMNPEVTVVVSNFAQTNIIGVSPATSKFGIVLTAIGTNTNPNPQYGPTIKRLRVDVRVPIG